jgi:hypothetical protein
MVFIAGKNSPNIASSVHHNKISCIEHFSHGSSCEYGFNEPAGAEAVYATNALRLTIKTGR